jgi:hypothetical protein
MTDREVEEIIRSNLNLQMNLAGIRGDFEAKLQRTWVGLTDEEVIKMSRYDLEYAALIGEVQRRLKEKNT